MRYRVTHKFQLDIEKEVDAALNDAIPQLVKQRRFTTLLRNGLRLALALDEAESILERGEHPTRDHIQLFDNLYPKALHDLLDRHHAAELERVQRELKELQTRVELSGVQLPQIKERQAVVADDTDLIIKTVKPSGSGSNFLKAMKGFGK